MAAFIVVNLREPHRHQIGQVFNRIIVVQNRKFRKMVVACTTNAILIFAFAIT
ncbi:hypothetical protein C0J52_28304 [Blattella germanica]|nr:hypothetical protein C0J52_28304 [Blattella germanica]